MYSLQKLGLGLLLGLTIPAFAADLAVLQNGFSIRHERREQMGAITRLYVSAPASGYVDVPTSQIDHFDYDISKPDAVPPLAVDPGLAPTPALAKAPPLGEVVTTASLNQNIDPDLVRSVIRAESGFNVRAVSPKGAQGLMQLMPQTASKLGVSNAFDAKDNVDGGTRYLRMLLERYNFDLVKALAAYNAGPQRVEQYGGVPPYYETRAYVARIIRDFNQKKLAQKKAEALAAAQARKNAPAKVPASKVPALVKKAPSSSLGPVALR